MLSKIYKSSLALLTDLYQLTMAYGYWKTGRAEEEAVFNLFFRKAPFGGAFALACGLEYVIDFIENFRFQSDDLAYLATLEGQDGVKLFDEEFLDYLGRFEFECDLHALEEGMPVFANEPLVRVRGPLLQAQLLETPLLNLINYQSLIATKAARIVQVTKDEPVLEFGLRRAQGIDGGLAASRAAYVGGCSATSNVLAGKCFGIPVKGTHAHSWVMSFDTELEAFKAYAEALPHNSVLLVDTYATIQGVRHAIEIGAMLRSRGQVLAGIRLDSGDLAELSKNARELLDEAGLQETAIVASSDLDEYVISEIKRRGGAVQVWGIGTRLVTGHDQPALGGVYKLAAIRKPDQSWRYCLKVSDPDKFSNPGIQQIRRYFDDGRAVADIVFDDDLGLPARPVSVDLGDSRNEAEVDDRFQGEDLLKPIFERGKCVYRGPDLKAIRRKAAVGLDRLPEGVRKLTSPDRYPVGLEKRLFALKQRLNQECRRHH